MKEKMANAESTIQVTPRAPGGIIYIYRYIHIFPGFSRYHLVIFNIAMENHHAINR
jgi:hypothetical protein